MCSDVSHASKHFHCLHFLFLSVTFSCCRYPAETLGCKSFYLIILENYSLTSLPLFVTINRSPYHLKSPLVYINDHGTASQSSSGYPKDCTVSAEWEFGNESTRRSTQWKASRLLQRCVIVIHVPHCTAHRSKSSLPTGKSAQKALLSPAFAKLKGVPKVTTEAEAQTILQGVNAFAFFLRVQRGAPTGSSSSSPKALQIIPEQMFNPTEYYAWFYEGSQWTTYAGGILMVAIMLAGVMFPLWPPIMRLGVWYLSIAMLGLIGVFFGIAILRLIFYVITIVVASPGIWIFPQLFADVGFVRSFCRAINQHEFN
jgi:protein translocation Sec62 family protein